MELKKIFGTDRPIIGALHFCPLIGYPEFPGMDFMLQKALADLRAFVDGGVDAIIIENNYDIPHTIKVSPETTEMMTVLGKKIAESTSLPIGVSVLWNDFESALSIAKVIGGRFVRVPVFVDDVETKFGVILGTPDQVTAFRKKIQAEGVAIFADIQVKHATMLRPRPIQESARQAIRAGADGLIITGRWTGEAPKIDELANARGAVGSFPIIIGSGANKENVDLLMKYADCIIVSTSLKAGEYLSPKQNRNLKDFHEKVDVQKVAEFVRTFKATI
ncbi:MAG: BtpA/SgcQ family protein [Candidatus Staskawiczbacteria bacterium]|jgi:membrane complex biogenesis BtpA family protein